MKVCDRRSHHQFLYTSPNPPALVLSYLGRQEGVEMRVEREDGVVGDSLQELVQSLHPRLHELLGKTIHHALHHELLWQRLRTNRESEEQQRV